MIFSDVLKSETGQASTLLSMAKQLAASVGVAYAALAMTAGGDFRTAIILVAFPLALTSFLSLRLSKEDGAEIAGRVMATKKA